MTGRCLSRPSKPGERVGHTSFKPLSDGLYISVQFCDVRLFDQEMLPRARPFALLLAVAFSAFGLAGCGTINERLAAGVSDAIPAWAGGLPADAPPRPGTAKYDEFMKDRERKRLLSASERDEMPRGDGIKPDQAEEGNR